MIRKVVIGEATLYHGDCLAVLKREVITADIVVTSPPYNTLLRHEETTGMHVGSEWVRRVVRNGYPDHMPEPKYQQYLLERLDLARKKTKGLVWINHKVRYRKRQAIHPVRMFPYPIYVEVIWDRVSGYHKNHNRFISSHEGVWGFGKPHYWNRMYNGKGTVWRIRPRNGDAIHPCTFPPELIEPVIIASCPPRGMVLDPFMGRGTTGLVALAQGRRFTGVEKQKKYFDRACKHIEAYYQRRR